LIFVVVLYSWATDVIDSTVIAIVSNATELRYNDHTIHLPPSGFQKRSNLHKQCKVTKVKST